MKIEIELEEVEALRWQIKESGDEIKDLKHKLSKFSPESINRDIIDTAEKMFFAVMRRVCKELGISYGSLFGLGGDFDSLTRSLGINWWLSDDFKVTPFIELSRNFKSFFMELGYNEPKEKKKPKYNFEVK